MASASHAGHGTDSSRKPPTHFVCALACPLSHQQKTSSFRQSHREERSGAPSISSLLPGIEDEEKLTPSSKTLSGIKIAPLSSQGVHRCVPGAVMSRTSIHYDQVQSQSNSQQGSVSPDGIDRRKALRRLSFPRLGPRRPPRLRSQSRKHSHIRILISTQILTNHLDRRDAQQMAHRSRLSRLR